MTSGARGTGRTMSLILPLAVLGLSIIVYVNSLDNAFVLDDVQIVSNNPLVKDPGRAGEIWRSNYWAPRSASNLYRPLTIYSLALSCRAGGLDPWGYRLVNILLHGLASMLVYFLALRLFGGRGAAFASALLFASHPIHVEAVVPAVGRSECLAAALALLSLLLYLRGRGRAAWVCLPLSCALFLAATLAKESALVLPLLVLLIEWTLPSGGGRSRWLRLLPFVLTAGLSVGLRILALGRNALEGPVPFIDNPAARLGLVTRTLTAVDVTCRYLKLLAAPLRLSADYSYAEVVPVESPWSAALLVCLALLAALAVAAWLLRRRFREGLFGLIFFAAAYAPVSNVLLPTGTIMAERLMYLPSVGWCIVLGALAGRALSLALSRARACAVAACVVAVALLGARTRHRNKDFRNNGTLFEKTVLTSPGSVKMRLFYADYLSMNGSYEEAARQLAVAQRVMPEYGMTHSYLGANLGRMGRHEEAEKHFRRAVELNPDLPDARRNLGDTLRILGRLEEAVSELRRAVELRPHYPDAWNGLGLALLMQGRFTAAEAALRKALAQQPLYYDAEYNLGRALEGEGRFADAEQAYRRALRLNPVSWDATLSLALSLEAQGEKGRAAEAFAGALLLRPSDLQARQRRAKLLAELARYDEAIAELGRAAESAPSSPQPWNNMGVVYRMKGDRQRARECFEKALAVDPGNARARAGLDDLQRTAGP